MNAQHFISPLRLREERCDSFEVGGVVNHYLPLSNSVERNQVNGIHGTIRSFGNGCGSPAATSIMIDQGDGYVMYIHDA